MADLSMEALKYTIRTKGGLIARYREANAITRRELHLNRLHLLRESTHLKRAVESLRLSDVPALPDLQMMKIIQEGETKATL